MPGGLVCWVRHEGAAENPRDLAHSAGGQKVVFARRSGLPINIDLFSPPLSQRL